MWRRDQTRWVKSYFQMPTWKHEESNAIKKENVALLSESSISQVIQVVMEVPLPVVHSPPELAPARLYLTLVRTNVSDCCLGYFRSRQVDTETRFHGFHRRSASSQTPPSSPACPQLSQPMRAMVSQTQAMIKSPPLKYHSLGLASTQYGLLITFL